MSAQDKMSIWCTCVTAKFEQVTLKSAIKGENKSRKYANMF